MRNRRRPRKSRSRWDRRRTLAFERLDARTVLSVTMPLAGGLPMPPDVFGAHAPQGQERDAARVNPAGMDNSFFFGRVAAQPIGGYSGAGGFGGRSTDGDVGRGPSNVVRLDPFANPSFADALGPGADFYVLNLPGTKSYLFIRLPDPFDVMPPPSPSSNVVSEGTSPISSGLNSASGVASLYGDLAPSVGSALPAIAPAGVDKADVGRFSSATATAIESGLIDHANSMAGLQPSQNPGGVLFVLPSQTTAAPGFGGRTDGQSPSPGATADESAQRPQFNSEGGLIELDSDDGAPGSGVPGNSGEDESVAPKRDRSGSLADDFELWNDVLDAIDEQLAEDPTRKLDANADELEQAVDGQSSPAGEDVASFDQGGMIELAAGALPGEGAATAVNQSDLPLPSVPVTIDVGIAMFQAFELSTESTATEAAPVAPAVDPQPAVAPAAENVEASTEGNEQEPSHVAAGVGLGILAAVPLLRRHKQLPPWRTALQKVRKLIGRRR